MPSKAAVQIAREPENGNVLLDSLPLIERRAVLGRCDRVELEAGSILCEPGEPFTHAYFPLVGNISLVKTISGHEPFEAESIGREGMLGTGLVLGVNLAPLRGVALAPCVALRITATNMQSILNTCPEFSQILQRYLHVVLVELLQTTGCIRFHEVSKRLARGLLLAHDRAKSDDLFLTHALLAEMLGVQRGAVTIAAINLQREGTIQYSRGKISILDRKKLEAASCECYRASLESYASILS